LHLVSSANIFKTWEQKPEARPQKRVRKECALDKEDDFKEETVKLRDGKKVKPVREVRIEVDSKKFFPQTLNSVGTAKGHTIKLGRKNDAWRPRGVSGGKCYREKKIFRDVITGGKVKQHKMNLWRGIPTDRYSGQKGSGQKGKRRSDWETKKPSEK